MKERPGGRGDFRRAAEHSLGSPAGDRSGQSADGMRRWRVTTLLRPHMNVATEARRSTHSSGMSVSSRPNCLQ